MKNLKLGLLGLVGAAALKKYSKPNLSPLDIKLKRILYDNKNNI